jgi:hypothetical protein
MDDLELQGKFRKWAWTGFVGPLLVVACAGGSGGGGASGGGSSGGGGATTDDCPSFAGSYQLTTEIVSTTCPVGLHALTQGVFWYFTQTAPSCSFTMTNSLYSGSTYSGYFSWDGTQGKITWTSVTPSPMVAGHALTYSSEDLTIIPWSHGTPGTVWGSFDWSSAYPCTGTTNVCRGNAASSCLTPD